MEGPFYGQRKPKRQNGCKLLHVSDLPLLGAATIEEARSLLYYFREAGYGPLVVGGISMGGLHAAMVATLSPFPVGTASLVGPPSAVPTGKGDNVATIAACNPPILIPPTTRGP